MLGQFLSSFAERFQVIFLVIFRDAVPFVFDLQKAVYSFHFAAIRRDVARKLLNNYLFLV